jgi:hypothetical protein
MQHHRCPCDPDPEWISEDAGSGGGCKRKVMRKLMPIGAHKFPTLRRVGCRYCKFAILQEY